MKHGKTLKCLANWEEKCPSICKVRVYFVKFEPGRAIEVETGCLALKGDSIGALKKFA